MPQAGPWSFPDRPGGGSRERGWVTLFNEIGPALRPSSIPNFGVIIVSDSGMRAWLRHTI